MNIRDIWTIARKELKSCFHDKVLLLQIVFVPFLVVFGFIMLMSLLSQVNTMKEEGEVEIVAYSMNAPDYMNSTFDTLNIKDASENKVENIKKEIESKKCDLLIVFPESFELTSDEAATVPNIDIWYNSSKNESLNLYNKTIAYLNTYQPSVFTINSSQHTIYDLVKKDEVMQEMLGMSLPVFLLMAVFTVCMNIAAESIVGDKERGFLNTMLIAPIKRSTIAAGKSFAIFVIALTGGVFAFLGMSVSLPHMVSAMGIEDGISYGVCDYILLFAATITAVFALTSILLIVSTFSKDIKQATNIASVFMIALTVMSMLTTTDSFQNICEKGGIQNALIPVWNATLTMQSIVQADFSVEFFAVSCVVNLLFCMIVVYVVGKCFENEKIVNA